VMPVDGALAALLSPIRHSRRRRGGAIPQTCKERRISLPVIDLTHHPDGVARAFKQIPESVLFCSAAIIEYPARRAKPALGRPQLHPGLTEMDQEGWRAYPVREEAACYGVLSARADHLRR
jgi:hypothetical protein